MRQLGTNSAGQPDALAVGYMNKRTLKTRRNLPGRVERRHQTPALHADPSATTASQRTHNCAQTDPKTSSLCYAMCLDSGRDGESDVDLLADRFLSGCRSQGRTNNSKHAGIYERKSDLCKSRLPQPCPRIESYVGRHRCTEVVACGVRDSRHHGHDLGHDSKISRGG